MSASIARQKGGADIIVIDSDSEGEDDLDRKPAAKKGGGDLDRKPAAKGSGGKGTPCISLLDDDSDEENCENRQQRGTMSPYAHAKKRKSCWLSSKHEAADLKLAMELQRQEDMASQKANASAEKRRMAKSSDGKAVLAVQEIIALVQSAKAQFIDNNPTLMKQHNCLEAVTIDDMVFFAKNLLDLQGEYISKNIPAHIDVGYHYTGSENMANIRTHGLLTRADRQTNKVQATNKGSMFGDGIYTANNGTCFSAYGNTGLLVGRLKGKMMRAKSSFYVAQNQAVDANTIVGDKLTGLVSLPGRKGKGKADSDGWPIDDSYHEVVLRTKDQALPMVKFDASLRQHKEGKEAIRFMKTSLEGILDRLFNKGLAQPKEEYRNAPLYQRAPYSSYARGGAAVPPVPPGLGPPPFPLPPGALPPGALPPGALAGMSASLQALLPPTLTGLSAPIPPLPSRATAGGHRSHSASTSQTLNYSAPQNLTTGIPPNAMASPSSSFDKKEDCVICHEQLKKRRKCVALSVCGHIFHNECIQQAFKVKPQCPVCRKAVGEPQGKCPSGTMTVHSSSIRCSGFQENSFLISYSIAAGVQKSYHDNPGKRHGGKIVNAYLPDNSDGQNLLKRLKYAFLHGLTFTVGTSMTTGAKDQCTWASVHHKTAPSGGARAHGWPDADYFENCNGELDGLGVPSARGLNDDGTAKK
ncbi:hypothetical protein ACHAXT_004043 [Thalassiosira profunda]